MKTVWKTMTAYVLALLPCAGVMAESYPVPRSVPQDQPMAEILAEVVVAKQPRHYMGWPDMVVTPSGELIVVFSGDRDWHVDPWGKVMAVRSTDGGKTWTEPELWVDTPLDDRGTGIEVFPDGTLFVTYHASLAFATRTGHPYDQYKNHADLLTPEIRAEHGGFWGRRSHDNGRTWGPPMKMPGMTPHGPIQLRDGRLLLAGATVYESHDLGESWAEVTKVEKPDDWKSNNAFMSESHAVETDDGRIIVLARYNERATGDVELRQVESSDGGKTWTAPRKTGMQGYPAHVVQLSNGWLLASYGRRIEPMGQRACISKDGGKTWLVDQEIILSNAVEMPQDQMDYPAAWDLGYPVSAELPDGSIWTVYYQVEKISDGEYPSLMGTHWRIKR